MENLLEQTKRLKELTDKDANTEVRGFTEQNIRELVVILIDKVGHLEREVRAKNIHS